MTQTTAFTSTSSRFSLPLLFSGQAQKEFTVNEALSIIDTLLHATILGEQSAPPANPVDGDTYLVGASATGAWSGADGHLASYQNNVWVIIQPRAGMRVFDESSGKTIFYNGAWLRPITPQPPQTGTIQDTELREAFTNLIAALNESGILAAT